MLLSRDHLAVLLNALYEGGDERIAVTHPCDEIGELLRIDLEDDATATVRFSQGKLTYGDNRDEVRRVHGDDAYQDLPQPGSYCRAVTGSGLVPPENAAELDTFLERHTHPDLAAGHPPVMVGYDQNLFGFRIPEMLHIDPVEGDTDDANRPPTNGYALSSGVKDELDWHYKNYETGQLEAAFGEEFAQVGDQPAGDNRRGFLGLYEFRDRLANRAVDIVESDRGDEAIVDAYKAYDDGNRKRVLLFSNDHGFIEYAQDQGIWAHHVGFPIDLPRTATGSWEQVTDLLYVLTVLFGVLRLPKVTLYGVWEGKDGLEWQREQLTCSVRSPVVEERLERHLALVDAWESLE